MALIQAYIPFLNPIRFVPQQVQKYSNFDNDWFANQIQPWQQKTDYAQKWPKGSAVVLQFHCNFSPVQLKILDCSGKILSTIIPNAISTGAYSDGFTYYQTIFQVPDIDTNWFCQISIGFGATVINYISEPQHTYDRMNGLMEIRYSNSFNDQDVYFDGGIEFVKYIEAYIGDLTPKSNSTLWIDQPNNVRLIRGVPYREFKFFVGGTYNAHGYVSKGVPQYEGDFINGVFCCDRVLLNGVQYTKIEGANWDKTAADQTVLYSFSTDISPTKNVRSLITQDDFTPAQNVVINYNINTKVFGSFTGNAINNLVQITEVE
jgi:hypothetical protein